MAAAGRSRIARSKCWPVSMETGAGRTLTSCNGAIPAPSSTATPGPESGGRRIDAMTLGDNFQEVLIRIAMMGVVPGRWFMMPPDPAKVKARSGRLTIEIVSHCWQYAHLLAYQ